MKYTRKRLLSIHNHWFLQKLVQKSKESTKKQEIEKID